MSASDSNKLEKTFEVLHNCVVWILRVVVVPIFVFIALICYQGTPFVGIVNLCYVFAFVYIGVFIVHDFLQYMKAKRETKEFRDSMRIEINKMYGELRKDLEEGQQDTLKVENDIT